MERLASAEGSPELGQYADGFVAWLAGPAAGLSACADTEKPLPEALVAPFRQTPQQRERSRLTTQVRPVADLWPNLRSTTGRSTGRSACLSCPAFSGQGICG